MKRLFLLTLLTTFILIPLSAQKDKAFARWSATVEYGYNYFDGDVNQNLMQLLPASYREITINGSVEYAFTPIWGLALDYAYFPLKAENTIPQHVSIATYLHSISLDATINFTRIMFPQANTKFYIIGAVGAGYAYYETNPIDLTTGLPPTNVLLNSQGKNFFNAATFPVTFSLEYNLSKPLALGGKVQYRAYNKDNLEGYGSALYKGVTNDFVAAATVYVRYKFGAIKNDHVRNIKMLDYLPDYGLTLAKKATEDIAKLKTRVDTLDKRVDTLDKKVNNLIPRVERVEKWIDNKGEDSDNDGVIDDRDLEPNTPPNTPVDFYGRALKLDSIAVKGNNNNQKMPVDVNGASGSVYFDFDRIDLDDVADVAIASVAKKMGDDPTLMVEIRGYCDKAGDVNYNMRLSQRRADKVRNQLIKVWGINPLRIIANGKGVMPNSPYKYRLNRRCDFFFNKDTAQKKDTDTNKK